MNPTYKDAWDYKEVTVAGWGYTDTLEEGEWYHDPDVKAGEGAQLHIQFHTNYNTTCNLNHFTFISSFDYLGINAADKLQKITTTVMPIRKCKWSHRYTGSPVNERKHICAGGEKGTFENFRWSLDIIFIE